MRRTLLSILICLLPVGCAITPAPPPQKPDAIKRPSSEVILTDADIRTAARNFTAVVERVEPVAEKICRDEAPGRNCDFRIVVDDNPGAPANAFQTEDREGRPILVFTVPLIFLTRNQDELAFVMAHEAAHHIQGHLARQRANAQLGAQIAGTLFGGRSAQSQEAAQQIGARIGARRFSKDFELEADALGTRISFAAGFDPVNGAVFFTRIPDPQNRFLGTHPANADRIETVRRVAAGL